MRINCRAINPLKMPSDEVQHGEKIGIMGGTFDPVHFGHLFAAEFAREAVGLSRVIFMPSGNPPHKSYDGMAPAEDRFEMARLAIENNPGFEISRAEVDREGVSYTSDTLEFLSALNPGASLFLITGLDAALDIPNWHEPLKILSFCKILVIARSGYIRDKISMLDDMIRDSLLIFDTDLIDISATDIRNKVRSGCCIRYMTPDVVCDYIIKKNLYSGTEA
jgi:nicotinate-nucleotide adenylyltransferase